MNHEYASKSYQEKFKQNFKDQSVVSFQKDFKDQVSRFLSKRIFRRLNFDPGSEVTSKRQTYVFTVPSPRNRRTVVGIESAQHYPIRVCSYFRQHLPVKGCQTGS